MLLTVNSVLLLFEHWEPPNVATFEHCYFLPNERNVCWCSSHPCVSYPHTQTPPFYSRDVPESLLFCPPVPKPNGATLRMALGDESRGDFQHPI